ncbi:alpha/beta hydrolase [Variovorax sp. Root411]|uniref:alpha/beta hydrolase n=1 Tax=Variovorax sp. Root411 TaxID=1736530 RepID=UPI001EEAD4FE|nr:alpha/beta hydrolase-fold protein [Variovorax sp. Root411]
MRALVFAGSCALLVVFGVWNCGGGGGGGGGTSIPIAPVADEPAASAATPAASSRVVSDTIASAKTGASYPLEIYLPASYDGGSAGYPVIYAMDGDAVFNAPGTRFSNFRDILDARRTEAILVGIGGSARRTKDYILPGATAYHDFLTLELVPFIEARYRADAGRRLLTGLSLSGSMTGIALFLEGAADRLTFSHFLSFEGSFGVQADQHQALEEKMHDALAGKPLPATLVLTRCDNPAECNFEPVDGMYRRLLARSYRGLAATETTYSTTHTGTDIPSFSDAIAKVLP